MATVIETVRELRGEVGAARRRGESVGLVPTMGALHEGHLSLVRRAASECDLVIVSVFVNPLQFGPAEDFDAYPRMLEADTELAASAGAGIVFAPSVSEVYPRRMRTTVMVSGVSEGLCGDQRPGHFDGVSTVVAKLFDMASADRAYFGRKDAQQLAVITTMAQDLSVATEVVGCPTVREPDGLAMSSRNAYLSSAERQGALSLSAGLAAAARLALDGTRDAASLESAAAAPVLAEPLAELDYAELHDFETMERLDAIADPGVSVIAVAARLGQARLIDNYFFECGGDGIRVDPGVVAEAATHG